MQGHNLQNNNRLGTVDIHFTTTAVHGTLILERVSTAMSILPRTPTKGWISAKMTSNNL